jgi:hypothetical protein
MKLIDIANILRSKNAGPLYITFDVMFDSAEKLERVLSSLTKEKISKAYDVDESVVDIIPYPVVNSLKITFPRKYISGSIYDNDVYGCQQHMPLGNVEVE